MEKNIINENTIQYRILEKLDRVSYYTSAYLFHDNGQGILLDSGYYEMGDFIKKDLEEMNIELKYIVISHYHKDHAQGAIVFDTPIIGSDQYETNLEKCNANYKRTYRKPDILVDDKLTVKINTSRIEIYKTPGHTPCGLSVLINGDYLYVSDNLLEDTDHRIIIPYLDITANPYDHYKTMLLYDELSPKHLIFTHGPVKLNADLNYEFSERIYYLEQLIKSDFSIDLCECLIRDKKNYAMTAIHKINQRNAKKYVSAQPTSFFK
ncbi:MBL fold metallo-hydrolase [Acidaminobacter sp. JC074]|uniref:MBL fold metallo-hydrolase n=1 Tax=Acidaminobacter sp. JC074 TaxID=2530199 RepID=UPI001F10A135|nr:MBL fold metallo-hydrolase [Acidaminobacter sp. JC074]MCH4888887.1 MBL fold metallo-hydrolase [Acidaminobacter sp. JC074]